MEQKPNMPAFVIEAPETIEWPVIVTHPVNGGELASFCFIGIFKRLSEEELDALLIPPAPKAGQTEAAAEPEPEPEPEPERMAQVLTDNTRLFPQLLVGWRGAQSKDGQEVPFTVGRLTAAVRGPQGPFLSAGIWQAVAEIRRGARLGN